MDGLDCLGAENKKSSLNETSLKEAISYDVAWYASVGVGCLLGSRLWKAHRYIGGLAGGLAGMTLTGALLKGFKK